MILRIFATDGFTPERVFRWSVDETAEHLCAKQVLWLTRLDGPWQKLVDWFTKHPSFRAVVLDAADRWGWYSEHEVTWRIAQGLYYPCNEYNGTFRDEYHETVDAVYWGHDDMAPPTGSGFKAYLKDWLASGHTSIVAPSYQLWEDFNLVRDDRQGRAFTDEIHCWLAKWDPNLRWLDPAGKTPREKMDWFRPLNDSENYSVCPWPFRHATGVDAAFREGRKQRKGFIDRWTDVPKLRKYDPDETWRVGV